MMTFEEALAEVNESLGIDACLTVRGDEIKGRMWDDDGGCMCKTYWNASDLRRLSAALEVIADNLDRAAGGAR